MLSPREFHLLMEAENKRRIDDYSRQATFAMWNRAAYHAKKLKQKDLFDAGQAGKADSSESFEEKQARLAEQQAFLDSLNAAPNTEIEGTDE